MNFSKRFTAALLAGTSAFVAVASLPLNPSVAQAGNIPANGYAKSHPKAQLDPALRDVPNMPLPTYARNARVGEAGNKATSFDLKTRKARTATLPALSRNLSRRSAFEPGQPGANTRTEQEPRLGRSVIGTDQRIKINTTTITPWRRVVKIYMRFPNGKTYGCSGALINRKYVLTAAHCIHGSDKGGWANRVEVIPGLNGNYKPYGSALATRIRTYTAWTNYRNANYDFALLTLNKNIGNYTGWFGYGYFNPINGVYGNLAGYPGDKGGKHMYYDADPIASSTTRRLRYRIDTYKGQSGSGVYRFYTPSGGSRGRYVFGVHTNGTSNTTSGYNSGTRIDSTKFNHLKSWISSGS